MLFLKQNVTLKLFITFKWPIFVVSSMEDIQDFTSVTRLGDVLNFGQLFKACGNNYFAHFYRQFCKGVKIFFFLVESILSIFLDIWRLFTGHPSFDVGPEIHRLCQFSTGELANWRCQCDPALILIRFNRSIHQVMLGGQVINKKSHLLLLFNPI